LRLSVSKSDNIKKCLKGTLVTKSAKKKKCCKKITVAQLLADSAQLATRRQQFVSILAEILCGENAALMGIGVQLAYSPNLEWDKLRATLPLLGRENTAECEKVITQFLGLED
jgi:hypothetical protein